MNSELTDLLATNYLGNTVQAYAATAIFFAAVLVGALILHHQLLSRLKILCGKTKTDFDDFMIELLARISPAELAFLSFYVAARSLTLSGGVAKALQIGLVVVLTLRAVYLAQAIIGYSIKRTLGHMGVEDAHASSAMKNLQFFLNAALWVGALIFILDNLGVNVTAAVAGLGIGGLAVAMAAQSIFKDLFSSFVIFMDKPFKVGDFIIVGDMMGSVDHIGIKTTRIRSLTGEMLVLSNSDLTSSRIRNFKLMEKRRISFSFGVTYETPYTKVKAIPDMVREIFSADEVIQLDRVHFKAFGDSALQFDIVYYVLTGDYAVYMDSQQRFNLALMKRFADEGIEFAYPTQTVHLRPAKN
ncbi:MAG: mechanosensitive ion channel family protein [Elusimicrobiota bacterium]